ncbi:hypothetical protein RB619_16260 [Flavobacterium sp. LHD-80]|uniref:hypothetical protein n=1 Tax=Flavobacterium sp. LHD-80 TaxID=3071411 RepID=UPI0027E08CAB|nr:hypothetical protein [Flavobacterium sp. LHD-80]MDQ6472206.1 hypothetical protein [Flavobacterium sp. LHD-80]
MTKKIHILLLVLTFGFTLMSTASYACGKSSEKSSCERNAASSKKETASCLKDCCKKDSHSKKGCSGKCDHSGCTTPGLQLSLVMQNEIELRNNSFNLTFKKPIGYYKNSMISDGFASIWLIPKIN